MSGRVPPSSILEPPQYGMFQPRSGFLQDPTSFTAPLPGTTTLAISYAYSLFTFPCWPSLILGAMISKWTNEPGAFGGYMNRHMFQSEFKMSEWYYNESKGV
eukprot:767530-Hanusia_phi.AAC.8